jgi:hypothetical protein
VQIGMKNPSLSYPRNPTLLGDIRRWDGMGWDGMGWDGMGWDLRRKEQNMTFSMHLREKGSLKIHKQGGLCLFHSE